MPTRIPTGFRFKRPSLAAISAAVARVRRLLVRQAHREAAREVAQAAVAILDGNALGLIRKGPRHRLSDGRHRSALSLALSQWREENGSGPPPLEVAIFSHPTGAYGIAFGREPRLVRAWMREAGVVDFAYWDDSDRPKGIDAVEWRLRARVWAEILPPNLPEAAGNRLKAVVLDHRSPPSDLLDSLPALVPTFRQRLDNAAFNLLLRKELGGKAPKGPCDLFPLADALNLAVSHGAMRKEFASAKAQARAAIPRRVTRKALLAPLFPDDPPRRKRT